MPDAKPVGKKPTGHVVAMDEAKESGPIPEAKPVGKIDHEAASRQMALEADKKTSAKPGAKGNKKPK